MTNTDIEEIPIEELSPPYHENLKEDFKLKIVLLGDSGVGKTNLISRYISNKFEKDTKSTIGVEFFCKTFKVNKDKIIKMELWDTAGQERYKSITSVYYKGAKGAFIVYDITSKKSFDNIDKWITEIKEKNNNEVKLVIIGNKIDLDNNREITFEEAKNKFKDKNILLIETSALNDTNVNEAFTSMVKILYLEYNILTILINASLTLVSFKAEVSIKGILLSLNLCLASSKLISLSSFKSILFPIIINLTSLVFFSFISFIHLSILSKDFFEVISYTIKAPLAPL